MRADILRRLRGLIGNAVLWGAIWFVTALAVINLIRMFGGAPRISWMGSVRSALMFSVMGTIAGTAFSTFIGLWYRGRSLAEISWVRFAIGGGVVTGLFVPLFISLMRLVSGDAPLAFESLLRNGVVGLVFGAAAAGGSLRLAQFAHNALPAGSDDQQLLE